nr:MAG TPA: hypothetical protein [Caudoviricetes sp.]
MLRHISSNLKGKFCDFCILIYSTGLLRNKKEAPAEHRGRCDIFSSTKRIVDTYVLQTMFTCYKIA